MFGTIKNHLKNLTPFDMLNQAVPVLMGIFIFFNPFPHTTSIKEICFYLSVFIVLLLLICKKANFLFWTPLTLPFGLFAFWSFLGLFFALDRGNSIHDFYSHLLRYIILYYIIINYFNSIKSLVVFSWIIILSVTIFSIGALYYDYVVLGNSLSTRLGYSLTEISVNRIGIITIFAILLSLQLLNSDIPLYQKGLLIILLLPLCTATFMTQTRSSIIAMYLSIIMMLFYKDKKQLVVFMLVFPIVVYNTPVGGRFIDKNPVSAEQKSVIAAKKPATADKQHTLADKKPVYIVSNFVPTISSFIYNNVRINHYYHMVEIVKEHPLVGIGFGMETYATSIDFNKYNNRLPDKKRPRVITSYPHSMLLDVAIRTGLIGLVFFSGIIVVFIKKCWENIRYRNNGVIKSWKNCMASALVMFFIIGIFEPVFIHMTEVVLFTILSMATSIWRLNDESI